jgi:hypothetical protein
VLSHGSGKVVEVGRSVPEPPGTPGSADGEK